VNGDVTRRQLLTGGAVSALAALAGCSATTPFVGKRLEESRQIDPAEASTLVAETESGDVTLRGTDRADIQVQYVKQSSSLGADVTALELVASREGDRLRLHTVYDGEEGFFGNRPTLDMDVTLPRRLGVGRVTTGAGDLSVREVSGSLELSTGSGDVTVRGVDGDVQTESGSGDIRVSGITGSASASAGSGDLSITDPGSLAGATTGSGDITTDVPAIRGETTVQAGSGDVTARLSPELDAAVDIRTSAGEIEIEGFDLGSGSDAVVGGSVTGTVGGGGPTLRLETGSGDITVEPL